MTYTMDDARSDWRAMYCHNCKEFKMECENEECGVMVCCFCETTTCDDHGEE